MDKINLYRMIEDVRRKTSDEIANALKTVIDNIDELNENGIFTLVVLETDEDMLVVGKLSFYGVAVLIENPNFTETASAIRKALKNRRPPEEGE